MTLISFGGGRALWFFAAVVSVYLVVWKYFCASEDGAVCSRENNGRYIEFSPCIVKKNV